jgi:F-type H+-transporting ATPase subunit gamma
LAKTSGIRSHMKSVGNIQKITNAMQMVASAKLHRAKTSALASVPFSDKIKDMLHLAVSDRTVMERLNKEENPLLDDRPVYKSAYIIIGSDRGLAGSYNTNVLKHAEIDLKNKNCVIVAVGRQIELGLKHYGYTYIHGFSGFSDNPTFEEADSIATYAEKIFTQEEVDEVNLIFTHFKSVLDLEPQTLGILPVRPFESENQKLEPSSSTMVHEKPDRYEFTSVLYEPQPEDMLKYLATYYTRSLIYTALIEGAACELASRMTAMSSASQNAEDLLEKLSVSYNKERQSGITNEINEIVSGAGALE